MSTLIYTLTYDNEYGPNHTNTLQNFIQLTFHSGSVEKDAGATINCDLRGGTRATAATCTGRSVIDGLGTVAWTSTLASTQLSYAPVTITAGAIKLQTATEKSEQTSTSSTGAASVATGAFDVRWAAGAVVLGVAGVVGVL